MELVMAIELAALQVKDLCSHIRLAHNARYQRDRLFLWEQHYSQIRKITDFVSTLKFTPLIQNEGERDAIVNRLITREMRNINALNGISTPGVANIGTVLQVIQGNLGNFLYTVQGRDN